MELRETVRDILKKLKPEHRTVMVLYHYMDLSCTEIAAIHTNDKFKDRGTHDGRGRGFMSMVWRTTARQSIAENKQHRRAQHEPGQDSHESVGRSSEQQERTANPAADAGSQKGYQHFPGHIQAVAIGSNAVGESTAPGMTAR